MKSKTLIQKVKAWVTGKDDVPQMSHYVIAAAVMIGLLMLVGCANPKHDNTYKPLLGKKCTQDGKVMSYFWMHTVYGDDIVKNKWCKK